MTIGDAIKELLFKRGICRVRDGYNNSVNIIKKLVLPSRTSILKTSKQIMRYYKFVPQL